MQVASIQKINKLERCRCKCKCTCIQKFCVIVLLEKIAIIVKLGPGYTFDFGLHKALFHTGEPALISVFVEYSKDTRSYIDSRIQESAQQLRSDNIKRKSCICVSRVLDTIGRASI